MHTHNIGQSLLPPFSLSAWTTLPPLTPPIGQSKQSSWVSSHTTRRDASIESIWQLTGGMWQLWGVYKAQGPPHTYSFWSEVRVAPLYLSQIAPAAAAQIPFPAGPPKTNHRNPSPLCQNARTSWHSWPQTLHYESYSHQSTPGTRNARKDKTGRSPKTRCAKQTARGGLPDVHDIEWNSWSVWWKAEVLSP